MNFSPDDKSSLKPEPRHELVENEEGSIHELKTIHVDGIDPVFEAQAALINHAVQTIGMGKVTARAVGN